MGALHQSKGSQNGVEINSLPRSADDDQLITTSSKLTCNGYNCSSLASIVFASHTSQIKAKIQHFLQKNVNHSVRREIHGNRHLSAEDIRQKPEKLYRWEPLKNDLELGNSAYPMFLIQIPMYMRKRMEK